MSPQRLFSRRSQAFFRPLQFGGWGDYQVWVDHGFLPRQGFTGLIVESEDVLSDPAPETSAADAESPDFQGDALPEQDHRPAVGGPAGIDSTRASIARVYDALLGGKDNYQADREVRDRLHAVAPEIGAAAWDSRKFLARVTQFLAGEAGISQFLDCGANLPSAENTHEVAQRRQHEASVIYVARDPVVLAHGRALLADNDRTHVADVDFRRPEQVVRDSTVAKYINFDQPLAVYHIGTLHHLGDDADPRRIMAGYIDVVPSGSYVVLAHLLHPGVGHELAELATRLQDAYLNSSLASGWLRTEEQILAMLDGLELLDPGLVALAKWWPAGPRFEPLAPIQRLVVGAVARKP